MIARCLFGMFGFLAAVALLVGARLSVAPQESDPFFVQISGDTAPATVSRFGLNSGKIELAQREWSVTKYRERWTAAFEGNEGMHSKVRLTYEYGVGRTLSSTQREVRIPRGAAYQVDFEGLSLTFWQQSRLDRFAEWLEKEDDVLENSVGTEVAQGRAATEALAIAFDTSDSTISR